MPLPYPPPPRTHHDPKPTTSTSTTQPHHRTWHRDGFLISTDPTLIPLWTLNAAFASSALYWAKALPLPILQEMLDTSLSFGLYAAHPPDDTATNNDATHRPTHHHHDDDDDKPPLIGYARLITDNVTFAYLTDVYILPDWQSRGLGEWLVKCVAEVTEGMPWLRRCMAILGEERLVGWYERHMGMKLMEMGGEAKVIQRRGRGSDFA